MSTEAEREAFEAWFDAWRLEDCPYDPTEPQRRARWGTYFRNCTWEAWQARASLASAPAQGVEARPTVTEAMVTAYLRANDAYWKRIDAEPSVIGRWRGSGTPSEATRVSLEAALAALSQGEQKK